MNVVDENYLSYDDKKKIVFRIQNLKSKKFYIKLFKIILNENIDYSTNCNGIFFNINKLTNYQFKILIDFLDECEIKLKYDSDIQDSESNSSSFSDFY